MPYGKPCQFLDGRIYHFLHFVNKSYTYWLCMLAYCVIRGIKSDSLIFFSSIAKHKSLSSYKRDLEKCGTKQMDEDLISQIYICSIICDKKFKYYKLGLFLASIGSILFAVLILIGLLII